MNKIKQLPNRYYVFSEGYISYDQNNGKSTSLGNLEIVEIEAFEDEYNEIETGSMLDRVEQTYLTDKWGGAELINFPDEFEPQFSNGLIDHGTFIHLHEAEKVYCDLIEGTEQWDAHSHANAQ